ncbi:MAG: hypothetical protein JSS29_03800 [Proteobacteria bacterium]|nr:hypothetical protein [Pseudomonadota bacterium]
MKTTTVGVIGTLAINLAIGAGMALVFSHTPPAQAREVARCPLPAPQGTIHAAHKPAGGHLAAVRMGWEAS